MNTESTPSVTGGANTAGLVARVQAILTSPRSEWPVIAAEPASVVGLYTGYFMVLAAIPALFGFIKGSLIGHGMMGITITTPIVAGLSGMVLGYALGLVLLYVVAMIVNALAPSFGGEKNQVQALKAVGYAWTAAWVAGIAVILPWLGALAVLAGGVYSLYLLYLGLPHTMKCPPEKALGYTVVTAIIAFVLSLVIGAVIAGVTGMGARAAGSLAGGGSAVTVDRNSRIGQLAEFGKRMEDAGRQADAARASGDPDAAGKALGAMMGAMAGSNEDGTAVEAVAPDRLRALLPESLDGRSRTSISASRNGMGGMQMSEAVAEYAGRNGQGQLTIEIRDMAAVSGMMAMAGAFGVEQSSETDSGFERTYTRDGRLINETWDSNRKHGSYSVTVSNRFQVEASGQVDSLDELKRIVDRLGGQLASLRLTPTATG